MKIFNNVSERDWQRTYAETFYDGYACHEIKTFGKLVSEVMNLMEYAYDSASANFRGNEKENPEELAKFHISQIVKRVKEPKNV